MELDDESDLTSLEGEGNRNDDASDLSSLSADSDFEHFAKDGDDEEDKRSSSRNGTQKGESLQLSPSRIGSGISRPAPAAGLKTYGGRKSRKRASLKQAKKPKAPPPPEQDLDSDSSLTSLASSPRKRRASASALPSTSSPTKRAKRKSTTANTNGNGVSKKSVSKARIFTNGDSELPNLPSTPTKRKRKEAGVEAQSKAPDSSVSVARRRRSFPSPKGKAWSLENLGSLVWVERNPAEEKSLQVHIFSPPAESSSPVLSHINNPSPSNVISYNSRSLTADTFWSLPSSSSRARPVNFEKIKSRWELACKEILKEDIRVNDGFPTSVAAILSQSLSDSDESRDDSASRRGRGRKGRESSPKPPEISPWSPPPPDPNVTIPGEHVLSATKAKGCSGKYYPAKIIAYVAPSDPTVRPKYTVHFMDNIQEDVTRDKFYIYEQEEFGTCKLGEFMSVESLHEGDAEDGLGEDIFTETNNDLVIPEFPLLPAPPPEKFCELSMVQQISHIMPILKEITNNNYKPAEKRVTAFLNGGRERVEMSREAPQRGTLTRVELNQLARIIKSWAQRIGQSNDATRDVNGSRVVDTHDHPDLRPKSPSKEDESLQEPSSSPEDLLDKQVLREVQDEGQVPSLPPSSLPPSSTANVQDDSPSNTPKVVGKDDLNGTAHESADKVEPFSDDLRQEDGVEAVANQQVFVAPTSTKSNPTNPSFEDLLGHEKIHFCTDVLLKEAIIQLLLWRVGKRQVPEPLSDAEEILLHEIGSNLASEFDIAHTVRALRMRKEKSLQAKKMSSSSKQGISIGGTRTRPRKV
ncbi:uncharacterized protein FOMMEDRAFT_147243 [Fomitiporia mediterranea MF3/22]|uniref:uncharacterized protein n=1 Tax=Fomitiporia mediterranea (strain MF3/22) TaxID=694068 RepID=UPI0004409324|nr:uncharacterized protein FOMMEDRAFT_147243 [Fomitiporia mediterranea MF3/22]EJD02178.1 hypothetical protein FOMMEDRAFT_147243 [Fomitiporia mediterranea MF3/22]